MFYTVTRVVLVRSSLIKASLMNQIWLYVIIIAGGGRQVKRYLHCWTHTRLRARWKRKRKPFHLSTKKNMNIENIYEKKVMIIIIGITGRDFVVGSIKLYVTSSIHGDSNYFTTVIRSVITFLHWGDAEKVFIRESTNGRRRVDWKVFGDDLFLNFFFSLSARFNIVKASRIYFIVTIFRPGWNTCRSEYAFAK